MSDPAATPTDPGDSDPLDDASKKRKKVSTSSSSSLDRSKASTTEEEVMTSVRLPQVHNTRAKTKVNKCDDGQDKGQDEEEEEEEASVFAHVIIG